MRLNKGGQLLDKIVIGREAYDKIMYFVDKAKFEISGFGNVQVIDGVPTVTDIILLEQENDPTETEMNADAIAKALYDHHVSGMEGELKFWWHSHVNMQCFWSSTDMATINDLTKNGWFIHGVFNKKNEYRCAYSNNDPIPLFLDKLDLEIDEDLVHDEKIIDAQIELLELNEEIEAINLEADEVNKKIDSIIAEKCDPLFDTLVKDKPPIVYTRNTWSNYMDQYDDYTDKYHGGQKETLGKHLEMKKYQATSMIPSTGQDTSTIEKYSYYSDSIFLDPDGALELFNCGYTEAEIEHMQQYCQVYDAEDILWYNAAFGKEALQESLDEHVNKDIA